MDAQRCRDLPTSPKPVRGGDLQLARAMGHCGTHTSKGDPLCFQEQSPEPGSQAAKLEAKPDLC